MFTELEGVWDTRLPSNTFGAIRVDGKNFSRFTKGMRRDYPFSEEFSYRMVSAARALANEVSGAVCVFTQSDEISVIFQDLAEESEKWMGGRIQKMSSIAAALSSVAFNDGTDDLAIFDGRAFDLGDDPDTVVDYLMERYESGVRNSVGMLASHHFSHKSLMGKGTGERKHMLREAGHPWEDVDPRFKHGTLMVKKMVLKTSEFTVHGVTQTAQVHRKVWHTAVADDARAQFTSAVTDFTNLAETSAR